MIYAVSPRSSTPAKPFILAQFCSRGGPRCWQFWPREIAYSSRSEHEEQCAVMEWVNLKQREFPKRRLLNAIPNGGQPEPGSPPPLAGKLARGRGRP